MVYRQHAKASPGVYALLWRWHAGASAQACLDSMTELVRYGQVAGKIRKDEPGLIAWSIWSAVHGFVQFETRPEHDSPVDDDDDALILSYSSCSFAELASFEPKRIAKICPNPALMSQTSAIHSSRTKRPYHRQAGLSKHTHCKPKTCPGFAGRGRSSKWNSM